MNVYEVFWVPDTVVGVVPTVVAWSSALQRKPHGASGAAAHRQRRGWRLEDLRARAGAQRPRRQRAGSLDIRVF